jgi:lipid-A-disaccharide synthase
MKYYIIAGEASGDLHGSNLIKELHILDQQADIRCWGGDKMEHAGATLVKHYRDLAFMGFVEVALNIRTIVRNLSFCKKDILEYSPDVLLLIDYPGFNLRIAEWAHAHGIKVHYYISPQIWAWHQSRVHKIKKIIDKLYAIIPFEQEFYKQFDYHVEYVGHPLIDAIAAYEPKPLFLNNNKPVIAILPGSRTQEITKILSIMVSVIPQFPDYQFVVAKVKNQPLELYKKIIKDETIQIVDDRTYDLLSNADAALIKSGTSSLETALFNVPQVVCYKANRITYLIAKQLVKIKYASLVNLILGREAVKELIQDDLTTENLISELQYILNPVNSARIKEDYATLKGILGDVGASKRVAGFLYRTLT